MVQRGQGSVEFELRRHNAILVNQGTRKPFDYEGPEMGRT